jgi:gp16 family phage-associated protein
MQGETKPFNSEQISRVRAEFKQAGRSVSDWARDQGFEPGLVYSILAGKNQGTRGKSHEISVKLGLKRPLQEATVAGLLPEMPALPGPGEQ